MTLNENETNRQELIKHRLEKSQKTIEDVRFLIDNNRLFIAMNRIYYAMFYVVSALALKNEFIGNKHDLDVGHLATQHVV